MFSQHFSSLALTVETCTYTTTDGCINEDAALQTAISMISETRERDGIVYVIGNGGSAGLASHFSNDLMKALKIPSQTLYDSNLLTCLANDYGYEEVFKYPLEILLKPHDLLIAISSSGKSPNILKAAEIALEKKTRLITLSGFARANPLRQLGDLNFWIDRSHYGLVEMAHFFLLHTMIDLWDKSTTLVSRHAACIKPALTK